MKKFTQKSLSLLLAAICSFSVGASAMAADYNEPPVTFDEKTGELSLNTKDWYGDSIFDDYDIFDEVRSIKIKKDVDEITGFEFFRNAETIELDEENPYFCVVDKGIYTADKTELLAYPLASKDKTIYLPEECQYIDDGALPMYSWDFIGDMEYPDIKPVGEGFSLYTTKKGQFFESELDILNEEDYTRVAHVYVTDDDFDEALYNYRNDQIICIVAGGYLSFEPGIYENLDKLNESFAITEQEYYEQYNAGEITSEECDYKCYKGRIDFYKGSGYFDGEFDYTFEDYVELMEILEGDEDYELDREALKEDYDFMKYELESYYNMAQFYLSTEDYARKLDTTVKIRDYADTMEASFGQPSTFTAVSELPEAEYVWYVNGREMGRGETFTYDNTAESSYTVSVKAVCPNGAVFAGSETEVTVVRPEKQNSMQEFFAKISAFFAQLAELIKNLFGI